MTSYQETASKVIKIIQEKRALTPTGYYIEIHPDEHDDLVKRSELTAILHRFHNELKIIEIAKHPLTYLDVYALPLQSLSMSMSCYRISLCADFDARYPKLASTSKEVVHHKRLVSMAKIITGFARIHGYDPSKKKNLATGEGKNSMMAALDRVGIKVDSDVIRDCVTQSCELSELDLDEGQGE